MRGCAHSGASSCPLWGRLIPRSRRTRWNVRRLEPGWSAPVRDRRRMGRCETRAANAAPQTISVKPTPGESPASKIPAPTTAAENA